MHIYLKQVVVLSFLFFSLLSAYGQRLPRKPWKATLFFEQGEESKKMKGRLYAVSDTSITIRDSHRQISEFPFRQINRIRLVKDRDKTATKVIGTIAGATAGAAITTSAITKNRTGEGATIAGIFGGITGGLVGGGIGLAASPALYNLFSQKKFRVLHDPASYQLLHTRLKVYAMRNEP